jgi:hypothetical protein
MAVMVAVLQVEIILPAPAVTVGMAAVTESAARVALEEQEDQPRATRA